MPMADRRNMLGRSHDQADAVALVVGAATDSWVSGGGLVSF